MGNTQEAIAEYEARKADVRKMDIAKIATPDTYKAIAMILEHNYSDSGDIRYLVQ